MKGNLAALAFGRFVPVYLSEVVVQKLEYTFMNVAAKKTLQFSLTRRNINSVNIILYTQTFTHTA